MSGARSAAGDCCDAGRGRPGSVTGIDGNHPKNGEAFPKIPEMFGVFPERSWKILKHPGEGVGEKTHPRNCERNHWFCTGFTFNSIPGILPPQRYPLWLGDSAVCGTQVESKMLRCYRSSVDCRLGMHESTGKAFSRDGINIINMQVEAKELLSLRLFEIHVWFSSSHFDIFWHIRHIKNSFRLPSSEIYPS